MDDSVLIWLGIFIAIIVAGANEEDRQAVRWLGIVGVSILMIVFYK